MRKAVSTFLACVLGLLVLSGCSEEARLEQELEDAQRMVEATGRAAANAQEEYDNMQDLFDQYNQLTDQLESLPEGSSEYEAIVSLRNALVRKMMEEYPELEQYVTVN